MLFGQSLVVAHGCLLLDEGEALVQVEVFVLISDALAKLIWKGCNEHLPEVHLVKTMAIHVALCKPFTYALLDVAHILADKG